MLPGNPDISVFVRMLPYYEQAPLYNAYNGNAGSGGLPSKHHLAIVGISTLGLPEQPEILR